MLNLIVPKLAILTSIADRFAELNNLEMFGIGLGVATLVLLVIFFIVVRLIRSHQLKTHSIYINLDEGIFQGSDEELILKTKAENEVNISNIQPFKEGYKFNGFNIYKRYISSKITDQGVEKTTITTEELDGDSKDFIIMPDYDLYMVAKYSPLADRKVQALKNITYYSDFLTFDDLVSEIMHLNEDKENYPEPILIKKSIKHENILFIFKRDTIIAMLHRVNGLTKVFLRTSDDLDEKMLNSFYQAEDINDCYNWYSFVIIYNTKLSRFIRSFKNTYDEIDVTDPTSEVEFKLICSSMTDFSDPIVDRAQYLVDLYEKEKHSKDVPEFVSKREIPSNFKVNFETKANSVKDYSLPPDADEIDDIADEINDIKEPTQEKSKENDHEATIGEEAPEEDAKEEKNAAEEPVEYVEEIKGDVKEEKPEETVKEVVKEAVKEAVEEEVPEVVEEEKKAVEETLKEVVQEVVKEKPVEAIMPEKVVETKLKDSSADISDNRKKIPLTKLEEEEKDIPLSKLKLNRVEFVQLVTRDFEEQEREIKIPEIPKFPITIKNKGKVYALVYENSFGLVRVVVRINKDVFCEHCGEHKLFTKAKFPIGKDWYQFYLDDSFASEYQLKEIFVLIKDNV